MRATTLDAAAAEACFAHDDTPFPFYVDMGRDFILAPAFAALMNPFVNMVRGLRALYRGDWDRAVESREPAFRTDLANLFAPPRFTVPSRSFRIARTDGSELTDVDAVVLDNLTGSMALVQLKWHDVFARSMRERESRRKNLLAARDWVSRIDAWVGRRSCTEVAAHLGIDGIASDNARPGIFVVARHSARFSVPEPYDARSAWISWPELVRSVQRAEAADDVIANMFRNFRAGGLPRQSTSAARPVESFRFTNLLVEVRRNALIPGGSDA
jgi:hypothetical protein